MKRLSLLLGVFVFVLWSFGIAGHAIRNFEKIPVSLFDRDTIMNGLWVHALDNDGTYIRAETVPISDTGILLIFAIGLILVWVSRFGEKFFKNKKSKGSD
jgi:hypothetical protein